MKLENNINKGLKQALADHAVPLRDEQWERIQLGLNPPKKKKRFVFWIFALVCLAAVSALLIQKNGAAIKEQGFSKNNVSGSVNEMALKNETEDQTSYAANDHQKGSKKDEGESKEVINAPLSEKTVQKATEKMTKAQEVSKEHRDVQSIDNTYALASEPVNVTKAEEILPAIESELESAQLKMVWPLLPFGRAPIDFSMQLELSPKTETHFNRPKPKDVKSNLPKFTMGFSSGYSMVNTVVEGVSNEQKLHKDTRSLFQQSTSNQSSQFLNFEMDALLFPKLGLGLSSGLQYRNIKNHMDINYRLNQIPFRMPNGDIIAYVTLSDSMSPLIRLNNVNALRYLNMPIKLSYGYALSSKQYLQLSAGVNFAVLVGSKGNTFSLNEASTQPVGEMISNLFNAGYCGGLLYSRHLFKQWHIGVSMQYQMNRQDYNMDYGILKSRVSAYNFGVHFRYQL